MLLHVFALRAGVALTLGLLIGAERQWRQRTAGIRTNALVSVGAALFVLIAVLVEGDTSPTRIASQIVSGIGFIGAGVIFKEGFSVSGLNTAATIWTTSAVGSLAGFGFLPHAAVGTAMVLIVNTIMRATHRAFGPATEIELEYQLRIVCGAEEERHIRSLLYAALSTEPVSLVGIASEDADAPGRVSVTAAVRMPQARRTRLEQIVSRISLEEAVYAVRWEAAA